MENSERLDQQARPGIEVRTSRILVLRAETLGHLWGEDMWESKITL